jgi:hypothetical protein
MVSLQISYMISLSVADRLLEQSYLPFYGLVILAHVLYFITYIGVFYVDITYIHVLNVITQTFICLFLLIRFFPYRQHQLNKYDVSIVFGSALLLASNLIATEYSKTFVGRMVSDTANHLGKQTGISISLPYQ